MTPDEVVSGYSRVFLDTAPVIYSVERHPQYAARVDPIFDALDSGRLEAVTSAITLSEALVGPFRLSDPEVAKRFEELIVRGQALLSYQSTRSLRKRRRHRGPRSASTRRRPATGGGQAQ